MNRLDVRVAVEADNPALVRNESLCVNCSMCRQVCEDYIGVHGHYDLSKTADKAICIHYAALDCPYRQSF